MMLGLFQDFLWERMRPGLAHVTAELFHDLAGRRRRQRLVLLKKGLGKSAAGWESCGQHGQARKLKHATPRKSTAAWGRLLDPLLRSHFVALLWGQTPPGRN